jgi:hypothetical protein
VLTVQDRPESTETGGNRRIEEWPEIMGVDYVRPDPSAMPREGAYRTPGEALAFAQSRHLLGIWQAISKRATSREANNLCVELAAQSARKVDDTIFHPPSMKRVDDVQYSQSS